MYKKDVLFISGIPDNRKVHVTNVQENGTINWGSTGGTNLADFLKNDDFSRRKIILDTTLEQELPRQKIHAVFNEISDADTHRITLKKAQDFYQSISGQIPFFNPPSKVMRTTRDNIYKLLSGIEGVNVAKTVKIQPQSASDIYETIEKEGFVYPVIFRQAGDHGGISTVKIDDENEKFYDFPLDGRDYYLTQFIDYSQNKIYTKYRLVVIDGEVFIRHVIFSDSWMIHSKSREFMNKHKSYQRQEANLLKSFTNEIKPKIQAIIDEIYRKLELDYFGIDCNIDEDFNLILFEVNPNMNVLINNVKEGNDIWTKQIDKIKNAIISMIVRR
ncbi:hypothetical protein PGH07_04345 [Sulfurovum sp. zt1-1]|uniref:ATP-grasp domain-containing protein n=1 Tax=Sulfurovum zhangzhouensis TaxID=3019067 RepID=A0ABT7QX30_9BACT|nr:hypothetical protein [Sulfurovum zhangzhouensis]MDM5271398.1 hypothetical protein [Sulfurovum zhangzhouensis]